MKPLPTYRIEETYDWNYEYSPDPQSIRVPKLSKPYGVVGFALDSPLGIPAGPLLNGRWILYYASLGFDMLTYKTVRSVARDCYRRPNLLPVRCGQLTGREPSVEAHREMSGSWAVSFGMPSKHPDVWRDDIEQTRTKLCKNKVLSVSVVGTEQTGWSIDQLSDDYAQCAAWAVESGADCIETNLSCPNVLSTDGQIYQHANQAQEISNRVRSCIGSTPLIIKIGHLLSDSAADALVQAVHPFVDAIATTNSIATRVQDAEGQFEFEGQKRGICGAATREASIRQTKLLDGLISKQNAQIDLIGVGGIQTAAHVKEYLAAGASCVHLATEPMVNPLVGVEIRKQLS